MAALLEGGPIARDIGARIKTELDSIKAKVGKAPKLTAVYVGENASSQVYINNQRKEARMLGIDYDLLALSSQASQSDVEERIKGLNADKNVTAVIIEMPCPKHIDAKKLSLLIDPAKDAEGMHPVNLGRLISGGFKIGPCTALAVMELLNKTGADLYGKEVCIVGHSEIVGKPLSLLLLNKFATVTVTHIATSEKGLLAEHVKKAEIVIAAVGKPNVISGGWIKEGAIVIDVGINRVEGKIVGDVEFEEAAKMASFITPVPGGVGPLTTIMLMRNVLSIFKNDV